MTLLLGGIAASDVNADDMLRCEAEHQNDEVSDLLTLASLVHHPASDGMDPNHVAYSQLSDATRTMRPQAPSASGHQAPPTGIIPLPFSVPSNASP